MNFDENRLFMMSFARDRHRTSYVGYIEKFFAICYNLRGKQKYEKAAASALRKRGTMKDDKLKEQIDSMMIDKQREELAPVDILDVLLDPDNKEPITLVDQDGRVLAFEQVAVIPHDKRGE